MLQICCLENSLYFTEQDKEMLQMVHTVSVHLPMSPERKSKFQKEAKSVSVLNLLYNYYMNAE